MRSDNPKDISKGKSRKENRRTEEPLLRPKCPFESRGDVRLSLARAQIITIYVGFFFFITPVHESREDVHAPDML
eukprot:1392482-Amorphochlora_amoeboformis.AAC.1